MTRKNEKRKEDMDMEKQNHDEKKTRSAKGIWIWRNRKRKDKKADTGNTLRGAIPSPGIDSRRLFLDWENAAWRYSQSRN